MSCESDRILARNPDFLENCIWIERPALYLLMLFWLLAGRLTKGLPFLQIYSSRPEEGVRIKVLDGRNGSPIAQEHLQVWLDTASGTALDLSTNQRGIAVLQVSGTTETIYVSSNFFYDCRVFHKNLSHPSYPIAEIKGHGLAMTNTCGALKVDVEPGELIFFVRPKHWWEGLKQ